MRITRWLVLRHPKMNPPKRRQWVRRAAGIPKPSPGSTR